MTKTNKENRRTLQNILLTVCDHVYYQPPRSVSLEFPCIVYTRDKINTEKADNKNYKIDHGYTLTVISELPDEGIAEQLLEKFENISFDRTFITENLYHDVLTLYYK